MLLSVVIPAFNEENRLILTVEKISQYLAAKKYGWEIIIVDDGSTDKTFDLAAEFASIMLSVRVLRNDTNRGKGYSVKRGILASKGEFVMFTDADMSTPIEEMEKLFYAIEEGSDIAIGSRGIKGSDVKVPQSWYRQLMGKVFNLFVKVILLQDFNDTQCGFKLFKGDIARDIARDLKLDGFCFDVEMLYLAKKKRCKIEEVGVVWKNSPQSKVYLVNSSLSMFFDLLKIRKMHR